MNKGAYSLRKDKAPLSREEQLIEIVFEAIIYMEKLPANFTNIKCRRQLREVAQYLSAIDLAAKKKPNG